MKQNKKHVFCYYFEKKNSCHVGIKINKENERDDKICFVNESKTLV